MYPALKVCCTASLGRPIAFRIRGSGKQRIKVTHSWPIRSTLSLFGLFAPAATIARRYAHGAKTMAETTRSRAFHADDVSHAAAAAVEVFHMGTATGNEHKARSARTHRMTVCMLR